MTCSARILQFFHRALRPAVFEADARNLDGFLGSDTIVFVAHIADEDNSAYVRYKALAKQYRDRYSFAIGPAAEETSILRCRNNIDDEEHTLNELWRVEALDNFVKMCSEPLIPELVRRNEEYYSLVGSPRSRGPGVG